MEGRGKISLFNDSSRHGLERAKCVFHVDSKVNFIYIEGKITVEMELYCGIKG